MAEGSVTFLLTKLSEFLQKEKNLLSEVRILAEEFNNELHFMTAFLRVSEQMEDSDTQLKAFTEKVRDIVYDIEDALDDYKLLLPSNRYGGFQRPYQRVYHFFRRIVARHQIASTMQRIKSRVTNVSEMHRRYLRRNNIMEQAASSSHERLLPRTRNVLQLEEANPVGIEPAEIQLIEWLNEEKLEREVVSVVGMGGLGKTTLVKKVYDNKEVKKRFQFRAWISLSQSFTTEDLLTDISLQFSNVIRFADPQAVDNMDYNKLRSVIKEFLQERRYLIVLDNVSNVNSWYGFECVLPDNDRGSRILLTTRDQSVARASSPKRTHNMNLLPEEESWTLFCRKIFQNNSCPSNLLDVLKEILVRCQGLPLAIVAIAGVLATKDRDKIDEWELVHRSLGAAIEDNERMKRILSLSYNDLPYHLKYRLMYFSIFPMGESIENSRLVRLWIAEGFVQEKEGMTLEEVAEGYLNELIKRSLVQVADITSDRRVKACSVHDILLEMIILKSRSHGFTAIAGEQSMKQIKKVRRLSTHNVLPSIQVPLDSRLRSLLVFGSSDSDSLPGSLVLDLSYRCFRLLNVLDLGGTPLEKFPNEVVSLYRLKYLSLRNTRVNSVPRSVGKLQNLETLDLKHTYVTELPVEILKLQKLRHLLAYRYELGSADQIHTKYGCKVPSQIGRLQSVQKLCFLEANQSNNLLTELGKLNQLRRLGVIKLKREDGNTLCSSIEMLRNLRALSLTSMEKDEVINIESLSSPPRFLQRLYLTGRLEKLPDWIASIENLVKVVLKWSVLTDDPLLLLQHLPNLAHLELVEAYDGKNLSFQAKGFQRLKFLGLNKLDKLDAITIEKGAMPNLEKLIVQSCELRRVPSGIEYSNELKVLEFCNMPSDIFSSLFPNGEEAGDYWKVERVPEVYFTSWDNGNWDIISLESFRGERSPQSGSTIMQRPRHIWK